MCCACVNRFDKWSKESKGKTCAQLWRNCCSKDFESHMEKFQLNWATNLTMWYHPEDMEKRTDPQYHLPEELRDLRVGEQILIQPLCTYVPIVRLNMGMNACKGHVVCFPQNCKYIYKELPRIPEDVSILNVIIRYRNDNREVGSYMFKVRRKKVLDALKWLPTNQKV